MVMSNKSYRIALFFIRSNTNESAIFILALSPSALIIFSSTSTTDVPSNSERDSCSVVNSSAGIPKKCCDANGLRINAKKAVRSFDT